MFPEALWCISLPLDTESKNWNLSLLISAVATREEYSVNIKQEEIKVPGLVLSSIQCIDGFRKKSNISLNFKK